VFSLEHIHSRSRGGSTTLDNLALPCQGCNNHKAARTQARDPQTGEIVPLFHPRQHDLSEHFAWSADYMQVIGQTPTGRATVTALQLNRTRLINLRRIIRNSGLHSP